MRYKRPDKPTECEVQAEFYRRCRNAGIECHLEYHASTGCRLDAVIVRNETIVAIIECKRRRPGRDRGGNKAAESQRLRYSTFGVPLIFCCGFEEIESAFAQVRKIIAARSGGGWKTESNSTPLGSRSIDFRDSPKK